MSSFLLYFISSNTDDDSLQDGPWSQRVETQRQSSKCLYISKESQQIVALLMGVFRSVCSKGVGTNLHMYDLLVCFLVD